MTTRATRWSARDGVKLADLPPGARIGTGSPRRAAQLAVLRSDVTCVPIRGNANTRLAKVRDGELDAVVLAYAGLARIGHTDLVSEIFEPDDMVPAPGQGALAVECRTDDAELVELLATIDHAATRAAVTAERGAARRARGGLQRAGRRLRDVTGTPGHRPAAPGGRRPRRTGRQVSSLALWTRAAASGRMVIRERGEADAADAARLGRELAARMLALGAAGLMRAEKTDGNDAHD